MLGQSFCLNAVGRAFVALLLGLLGCGSGGTPKPAPPQLNAETEKFAFELVRITADCLGANRPIKPGLFAFVADVQPAGNPPRISDGGSSSGNEGALACLAREAPTRLRNPYGVWGRFLRVTLPLPGGAQDVRFEITGPFELVRQAAREACGKGQWDECERGLDQARETDPAGESAEAVKALREDIAKGRGSSGSAPK
jgi:hypothetical protein